MPLLIYEKLRSLLIVAIVLVISTFVTSKLIFPIMFSFNQLIQPVKLSSEDIKAIKLPNNPSDILDYNDYMQSALFFPFHNSGLVYRFAIEGSNNEKTAITEQTQETVTINGVDVNAAPVLSDGANWYLLHVDNINLLYKSVNLNPPISGYIRTVPIEVFRNFSDQNIENVYLDSTIEMNSNMTLFLIFSFLFILISLGCAIEIILVLINRSIFTIYSSKIWSNEMEVKKIKNLKISMGNVFKFAFKKSYSLENFEVERRLWGSKIFPVQTTK